MDETPLPPIEPPSGPEPERPRPKTNWKAAAVAVFFLMTIVLLISLNVSQPIGDPAPMGQALWGETQQNVNVLTEMINFEGSFRDKKKTALFRYSAYKEHEARLKYYKVYEPVATFYAHLKLIENGFSYSNELLTRIRLQGMDVITALRDEFSLAETPIPQQASV